MSGLGQSTRTGLCQAASVDIVISKYRYYLIEREVFKRSGYV